VIAALGVSLLVWVAASVANARAVRAVAAGMPPEWRDHPEVGPSLRAGDAADHRAALVRLVPWLVAAVAGFVALSALDVLPGVQVATAVAGGAWWAQTESAQSRDAARAIAERDGLAIPERIPGRTAYVATLHVLCLAIALTACFAGQAAWDLIG
jgi:hypothetical protein